ncbi:MAG TPA: enoyl-CoA hydratase-related protein [Anaerolineales bacterium]|nr:enoyl-CoA hydratase-related protein [Anaerolineales bacterium]
MPDDPFIRTEQRDAVLTITLDRPKANAFNNAMVEQLLEALKSAERDEDVRCVILTGAGRFFSAGQDVAVFLESGGDVPFRRHLERTYNRVVLRLRRLEKPVVAAINGAAAGAGLGIALATDIRLAAQSARFFFGFTGLGLAADSGTSLILPLLIGLARATEMAFTNEPLTAEQALAFGLVNRVAPDDDLPAVAAELGASLAAGPTRALGLTKRAFNRALASAWETTLDYEAHLQEIAGRTQDFKEGAAAFVEKRPPHFTGR